MQVVARIRSGGLKQGVSDRQKAAILLLALGPDLSAQVLKRLNEGEVELLVAEIAHVEKLPQGVTDKVLSEFHDLYEAQGFITSGGLEYASDILERALGKNKAREIIERLSATLEIAPFHFLRNADPNEILSFIEDEHPQTIALVLTHLRPEQASLILKQLETVLRAEVVRRIALMDRTTPDIIAEVENILESKVSSLARGQEYAAVGGLDATVKILNQVDRGTERAILEILEDENPELADEIRRKLFTFEDVINLEDRAIQRVLREVETKRLALALKTANDELKEKIFANMSQRAGEMLREDMEFLGPVRLKDVELAQQEIVNTVRRLEEDGEIIIARGGEEEIVV
ncbi:MAG: flagellar motor switch protein FliG [Actinobacteria bacterium]|nr:flagellar motor switch protein FliG [Actinomycetota bacterium]